MNRSLETYSISNLIHKEIENLNKLITSEDIKSIIKNLPKNKSVGPDSFTGEL